MKMILKLITVLIAVILFISAIYVIFLNNNENKTTCSVTIYKPKNKSQKEPDESNNESGTPSGTNSKHAVFIEEGTATWCENCPNVAQTMDQLYESGDYNFYYVSMIYDKNKIAQKRLKDDYNIYGYPTVFIDGGYKVISGDKEKSQFANAIRSAESRDVPNIKISVNISYHNDTDELETKVLVENKENYTYNGNLKVYLAEKISKWLNLHPTSDGKFVPYHFGFIDFIIDKNININSNSNKTYTETDKLSDFSDSDITPDDVMVFAVVFNSNSVNKYSYPDDNKNEFKAHYADAVDTAELVKGGNLTPIVSVTSPEIGKINLLGIPLIKTYFGNTYLVGKTTINVVAEGDDKVVKVDFYIDDKKVSEDTEAPFEYSFRKVDMLKHLFRKHTIKVIAYDAEGKTSAASFDVFAIWL